MPVVTENSPQAVKDNLVVFMKRELHDTSEHRILFYRVIKSRFGLTPIVDEELRQAVMLEF